MAFRLVEEEETFPSLMEEQKETIPQEIGRHAARSGARAGESLLGLPGDIFGLARSLAGKAAGALGVPEETISKSEDLARLLTPFGNLPTSTEIRETITEPLTGEYLEPRGKGEAIADDIVSDAATLLVPVKGAKGLRSGKHILRALGISAGANSASEIAGALGAGEKGQTATKLGSMMLLGALGKGRPRAYVSSLYDEVEASLKGAPKVGAKDLSSKLNTLKSSLKKGLDAPSEKAVLDKINKLEGKIKKGQIGVDELWASKRSLNEEMQKVLGETRGKANQARARKLFGKLSKDLKSELETYGKENPEFGKAFQEAEEAFGALAQSEVIGRFIGKHANKKIMSPVLYGLTTALAKGAPKAALTTAAGAGIYKGGQVLYRIAKSPSLRKHYGDVLKAASQENAPAMNRALKKLDEALQKEDKSEESGRFRLIEEEEIES